MPDFPSMSGMPSARLQSLAAPLRARSVIYVIAPTLPVQELLGQIAEAGHIAKVIDKLADAPLPGIGSSSTLNAGDSANGEGLPLFIVDEKTLFKMWDNDQIRLQQLQRRRIGVVLITADEAALAKLNDQQDEILLGAWPWPMPKGAMKRILTFAYQKFASERDRQDLRREIGRRTRQMRDVIEVGIALSAERNLDVLLDTVLQKARAITHADSGSLYLVEPADDVEPSSNGQEQDLSQMRLRFKCSQNDSVDFPFQEFTMPITTASISGYCVAREEIVNLDDVYEIPQGSPYSYSRDFDEKVGYRCKSMLVVPMINHQGDVIGCLQLINRKARTSDRLDMPEKAELLAVPFDQDCVDLVSSFGSQAAVAIDNSMLLESIERLFEGMVTAATVAIESRDPTTSGHSFRVASFSVGLAKVVSDIGDGSFCSLTFSRDQLRELRYAGLLHDFGKVGVREKVLVKAKKLYPWELDLIRMRFEYLRRDVEARRLRELIPNLRGVHGEEFDRIVMAVEDTLQMDWEDLQEHFEAILTANEPTVMREGAFDHLHSLCDLHYHDTYGRPHPMLTPDELVSLSIPKGSLNAEERLEIESHVTHTYRFLKQIPWTRDLSNLPEIAGAHHEKLDGSGYPAKLTSDEIPTQAKIMTIADIFDALTAADRPYKRAMPVEKALDILGFEVKDGHLDPELVNMFIERRVFEWAKDERED